MGAASSCHVPLDNWPYFKLRMLRCCPSLLAGLRDLDLSDTHFTRLPPSLSAATSLTRLCLEGNPSLRLINCDAVILAGMEGLHELRIHASAADRETRHMLTRLGGLGPGLCIVQGEAWQDFEEEEEEESGDDAAGYFSGPDVGDW